MPESTFFAFISRMQAERKSPPLLLLYGFNEFLGEHVIAEVGRAFGQPRTEFNFKRYYFDGEEETGWEEILDEANSSSFFISAQKVITVVLRDEKKIALGAAAKKAVAAYLQKPNPHTTLIVYVSLDLSRDDYKQLKKEKLARLREHLESPHTVSIDLDRTSEGEIKNFIKGYMKERKIAVSAGAIERIQEVMADDFASIIHQLPKLEAAAASTLTIGVEEVDELITGINSHSIWDLTEAIEREDAAVYLDILKYLFINGVKPSFIIGTLISYYHKIYTAKFLMKHRFSTADIGKVLQQPAFILNKFIALVKNFPDAKIQAVLNLIYRLDYESKTSGEESARISLQNFVFQVKLLK
ncbi:MAG: DNA polymerase III subunit delta [Acidobacteria bacterium]|jgi:DNA polymerase III delta subunit|nr:DNA polymerase III subunit delta [Acidobacteriota bacterium]